MIEPAKISVDRITIEDLRRLEDDLIHLQKCVRRIWDRANLGPANATETIREWPVWKEARSEYRTFDRRAKRILGKRRKGHGES